MRKGSINVLSALMTLFMSPAFAPKHKKGSLAIETRGPGVRHHKSKGRIFRQVQARRAACC